MRAEDHDDHYAGRPGQPRVMYPETDALRATTDDWRSAFDASSATGPEEG